MHHAKVINKMETAKNHDANIVRKYLRYLKLERNYSVNTLDAYERDLQKLLEYLPENINVTEITLDDLHNFPHHSMT